MILVTGGTGFIGSHTCVQLIKAGYDVLVIDDLSNSHEDVVNRIKLITGKKIEFIKGNVCDYNLLTDVFRKYKIDSVIHFAGYKAVGESVNKPLIYYKNNIDSTLNLLTVMRNFNVTSFIFSSSATVYAPTGKVPFSELSELGKCSNPYGWTKYMNEEIIQSYCNSNSDFSAVLLRYFNPVGAHESGYLGEDPQGIPNNLMPLICRVSLNIINELTVFGNDYDTEDGTCIRDYIHVMDLANAHILALKYVNGHKGCKAFNIGTGKGTSVLEMIKTFEDVNKLKINYKIGKRRAGDVAKLYADCTKAKKELSFTPVYTLSDMCLHSYNYMKLNYMKGV